MRLPAFAWVFGTAILVLSCRGEPPASANPNAMARLVDSLRSPVERATGLRFKSPPRSALRTRQQVRAYLVQKLDEELPTPRMRGLETAYRLFGLLPDALELRQLLLDLYTEQVAGYYDPDSATLFGVVGADPAQLRLVLAHEMVHALQGQYLHLDSILHETSNNDRLTAAQAVLEGQATLVSIDVLASGQPVSSTPEFWQLYREQVREQQSSMPVFARAPLVVREALIFPYLAGAEFMHWWASSPLRDSVPYGPRMPVSTEQILSPDRYARGDAPVDIRFPADSGVLYEDVLGESEIRVLMARLAGTSEVRATGPIGWGGDRYRVYGTPLGPALVWYVVWDDKKSADRFLWGYGGKLRTVTRKGYRTELENLELGGKQATMYVLAPEAWDGWDHVPKAFIAR
ncbi:MAG TPA: hypothetical protein VGN76_09735 [Gemmatimonadales bacterium]|jgi:hypothetical protein|nr:hypothetical protein [Gemmatimonadales bacterium]